MAEQMYELQRDVSQNHRLYNKDLAPIEIKRRKWGTYNFAALGSEWRTAFPRTCWRAG